MTDQALSPVAEEKQKREWISPLTQRKLQRFKAIKRGYYSFAVLIVLLLVSIFAELLVNNKAIVVKYENQWYFPTYGAVIGGDTFGLDYQYETNYRELKAKFASEDSGNFVLMPLVPYNPYEQNIKDGIFPPYPPNFAEQHFLGTDSIGRDVLARLIYGFRIAMMFSLGALVVSMFVGIFVGISMGYFGGWFDLIMQRLIEILSMVPLLYLIMIIGQVVKPSVYILAAVYMSLAWMGITWYMRSMSYKEKAREYVMAARALGAGHLRIIFRHILPNVFVMVITMAPFFVVAAIGTLTALDYLGFGLRPPTPSIGELLQQGKSNLDSPWIIWSAIGATSIILMLIQFIGEALREAFDPKRYTKYE